MLVEFKIKNFMSFKDESVFSMVASKDKTYLENNTISTPALNKRLLRTSVVYGANAAGKSNLIKAVKLVERLVHSANVDESRISELYAPFKFSLESSSSPSEFELTFITEDGVRYQYGFAINPKQVEREWLIAYPKGLPQVWFRRDNYSSENPWYFGRSLKGNKEQIAQLTRSDVLFLTVAAKMNHEQLTEVYNWFKKNLYYIGIENNINFSTSYSIKRAKEDPGMQSQIRNLLKYADFGIDDLEFHEEQMDEKVLEIFSPEFRKDFQGKYFEVYMDHRTDADHKFLLSIDDESNGTRKFFSLSGLIIDGLNNGWTIFVDELDSSLHPLLVRYIVELFHNPIINNKGAQLIFNTQDTTLMNTDIFRRDQIWFVEKDSKQCSHLYSLLDYMPRKDESLAKWYLQGRYGAVPFLSEPQWRGEGDE
jgi:AAA15 family ATPase/GTPase